MKNAKEFRIGNYILYDKGYIEATATLLTAGMLMQLASGKDESITPIPLTEEWLLKFGFEVKPDNPKQKPQYNGDFLFDMCGYQFSNSEKGQDGGVYSWDLNRGDTIIKHVHQLQNLYFALTGQELTIHDPVSQTTI